MVHPELFEGVGQSFNSTFWVKWRSPQEPVVYLLGANGAIFVCFSVQMSKGCVTSQKIIKLACFTLFTACCNQLLPEGRKVTKRGFVRNIII